MDKLYEIIIYLIFIAIFKFFLERINKIKEIKFNCVDETCIRNENSKSFEPKENFPFDYKLPDALKEEERMGKLNIKIKINHN